MVEKYSQRYYHTPALCNILYFIKNREQSIAGDDTLEDFRIVRRITRSLLLIIPSNMF